MKYKKILLSSTLAIALTLTGVTLAQGSANAATSDNTANTTTTTTDTVNSNENSGQTDTQVNLQVPAAQVTDTQTTPTAETTNNNSIQGDQAANSVAVATNGTAGTAATAPTAGTAETAGTAATADTAATAPTTETDQTTPATETNDSTDTDQSTTATDESATQANTQATAEADSQTEAASTNAGDTTTAPAGTSNPTYDADAVVTTIKNAETVPVVSNVVAGATGLVAPTSNKWGNAVHNVQNNVINAVGEIPLVGGVASTVLKIAQPLDLVDNVVGGAYGLVTGKSDNIPDPDNSDEETITPVSTANYTNNQRKGVVTTLAQTPLYDQVEQLQSRSLAPSTDWYTDITRVNTDTGTTYYRVSTNEYVNANDVQVLFS